MPSSAYPPGLLKPPPASRLFAPLSLSDRADRNQFAARLSTFAFARAAVFSLAVLLVVSVLFQTNGGITFSYSLKGALLVLIIAYASALIQWWVSKKRFRLYKVSLTLIIVDQALFGVIAYLTGGVASGATSLFGIACLVGGLLLGVPGAVTAALAGGIFFSLIVLMTQGENGILPPDQASHLYRLSEGQAAYYYVFNLLMLLLVGLMASYLAERLERAGGELKYAQLRVEQAERMAALGKLAAGLAHEIRNPLGSISGAVQMLRESTEREEDRDLCDIVLRESERLNELVTDMVDLSRKRQPAREPTDLGRIVRDVVELSRASWRGAQDVTLNLKGEASVSVNADPGQLRQLVWNLVRNALQATPSGGEVRVLLTVTPTVRLIVEDNGLGIDSEAMPRLFDAFYTTRSQGTGLGLAVVKRIADEHEFVITVTSDPGEGTQFVVDFGRTVSNSSAL